jgi:hypothetical protein
MDTAVALVQAYLHVNGYFTVAEYPVFEAYRGDQARAVTDLDILAVRFAGAGHDLVRRQRQHAAGGEPFIADPVLGALDDRTDMIVGEVKEGPARFNPAMRDPVVLAVALKRFGCCAPGDARALVQELLDRGQVIGPSGHNIRMVAFGDAPEGSRPGAWTTVPMRHVVIFLQQYLRQHWDVLRHAPIKDTALGVLTLIEKWGVDSEPNRPASINDGRSHGRVRVQGRS